ncbi:MAG: 23S rRNA (adenine(2503)-C(2))-methyltransferase RlmN [Buchnera aphidicola (Pentalonia nigronervosa)]|jgi:23S rRNA (adenine2503-C2)-methyltransferase|uniref:Dual-specificity RNA methyltransferase RlmN n=1 Tax=Buchnera aphidicola (Pentalonia nigronervosa) TaxID=1309793 RepID=A0A7H1AZS3_9GAMM|nr:MAG: 23S rRNA (adenine(2503)-C(2))-methyltransferase RlmN [Buchnera aphidicola (Pentalonia nigronervosa)]
MESIMNTLNISSPKINLLNLNRQKLRLFLTTLKQKSFIAEQIMQWMYKYHCDDFNDMSNISNELKKILHERSYIFAPSFTEEKISCDGTIKWIMSLNNNKIETVYIPEKTRATLCVSSQIGCVLKCTFCATGKMGFKRNLYVFEIIAQILQAMKRLNKKKTYRKITNIVFMGMGEPLLNLNNLIPALNIILDQYGFGLSKRKITVSTSGIVPALKVLSKKIDISLALSLHAPNDCIRNQIMPINKKYNIKSILIAIKKYLKNSNANYGGITIEYVMLHGINDSNEHARQLANILSEIPSKINLIPWNFFKNASFICSKEKQINTFANILRSKGFVTTIRKNRGQDINAACGQLNGNIITAYQPI